MSVSSPVAGETKLEKYSTPSFIPGSPGRPGLPGQPAIPAHFVTVTKPLPIFTLPLPVGWFYTIVPSPQVGAPPSLVPTPPGAGNQSGGFPIALASQQTYSYNVLVPAQAAIPPTPGVPGVPSQTTIDNNIGWNAGSQSTDELVGAGRFQFYALTNSVGVVVGIAKTASVDYTVQTHAMYLARGQIQFIESGAIVGSGGSYTQDDLLEIVVLPYGTVEYRKNNRLLYKSLTLTPGFVRLNACLYFPLDAVYDVARVNGYDTAVSGMSRIASIGYGFGTGLGRAPNFVPFGLMKRLTSSSFSYPNRGGISLPPGGATGPGSLQDPTTNPNTSTQGAGAIERITGYAYGFGTGLGRQPNVARSTLHYLTGATSAGGYPVAGSFGHTARSVFPPIISHGGHAAAYEDGGAMQPISGHGQAGELAPAYGIGQSVMTTLSGYGLALLYQRAKATSTFPPLIGIAADKARYTTAKSTFRPLIGKALSYPSGYALMHDYLLGADLTRETYHLFAFLFSRGGVMPAYGATLGYYVGRIKLPNVLGNDVHQRLAIHSTMAMRPYLIATILSTLHASTPTSLTTTGPNGLAGAIRLVQSILGHLSVRDVYTIAQLMRVMMFSRLGISGPTGGSGNGSGPGGGAGGGGGGPVGVSPPTGQYGPGTGGGVGGSHGGGGLTPVVTGTNTTGPTDVSSSGAPAGPRTWVVNAERGTGANATTRYENYDFNSFAQIGANYYGVREDGLYLLDGDDDDGDPILASVDFGSLKFGSNGLKRPTNAYAGMTSSGNMVLRVDVEGQSYLYQARASSAAAATQRFDFGKGLSGNFLDFELFNGDGEDFELESIEFMILPLSRRVR